MKKFDRQRSAMEPYMRGLAALGDTGAEGGYYLLYGYGLIVPGYRYLTRRIRELSGTDNQDALRRKLEWLVEKGHRQSYNQIRHKLLPIPAAKRPGYAASRKGTAKEKAQAALVARTMDELPDAGIAAYDLGMAVYLCRAAMKTRWIGEAYGRDLQTNCANALQEWYSGWEEYMAAYIVGAGFAAGTGGAAAMEALQTQALLLLGPGSPIPDKLAWRMNLPASKYREAGL